MLRRTLLADVAPIRALMQSVPGFWSESWRDDVLERALGASALSFVWEEEKGMLGYVCAHDLGFRAYLSELVVATHARGRGVGEALVRQVETELAQRGCAVLIADVWRDAEGFYRALGWESPQVILLRRQLL